MLKCSNCGSTHLVGITCKLCAKCCSAASPSPHQAEIDKLKNRKEKNAANQNSAG